MEDQRNAYPDKPTRFKRSQVDGEAVFHTNRIAGRLIAKEIMMTAASNDQAATYSEGSSRTA